MSNVPNSIVNINNICEGLNLVKIIKKHDYVKMDNLNIVLKTMYPHAQYNDPVPVKHGCKYHYRNAISGALWNINATCSASTLNKLIGPIYNFDIANPEYIEPNNLSLEELIPAFAEFATNHKYPMNEDTELISIGRPIKLETFEDCRIIGPAIVNLLRCNDTALLDAISAEYSNFNSYIYHNAHWDRFAQDPNFAYISKTGAIRRNSHLKLVIAVIYTKLLQEREASEQDREINVDAIRVALEAILPGYAEANAIASAESNAIAPAEANAIASAEANAIAPAEANAIAPAEANAIAPAEANAIASAESS